MNGAEGEFHTLWREGRTIKMIDQRKLPHQFTIISLESHEKTADAIKNMICRGAGAIGVAAGYGMAQAALEAENLTLNNFKKYIIKASETLSQTRPTAVNLFHSIERCLETAKEGTVKKRVKKILNESEKIAKEDLEASEKMGSIGNELIKDGYGILTHCNAGALAFLDLGTALSPIRSAHKEGKKIHVYVDETRPRCQGSRLTAWELQQEGIPYSIIVDNAAGYYMRKEEINMVIVGADRITSNGDVVNKIGTYEKAVLAKENEIEFYVAAPKMTFDLNTQTGDEVKIEERDIEEVTHYTGINEEGKISRIRITEKNAHARNPSFDITPSKYVTGFITEMGMIYPPYKENIKKYL